MEKHVTNICRSAYIEIRTISNIRHYLMMLQKPSSVPLFCQNLTTVILFYQVLQNIFLTNSKRSKIRQPDLSLFKTRKHEHTNPLLQKLHWLPIVSRIQYKVAPLCYNSFTESYPAAYLSELLDCLPSRSRQLRSISDTRTFCRIPFTKTWKTFGERAFSFTGPTQWNSLPYDVRHSASTLFFQASNQTWPNSELRTHVWYK